MSDNEFDAPEASGEEELRQVRPGQRRKTATARNADTSRAPASKARNDDPAREGRVERDFGAIEQMITDDNYDILPGLPQDDPEWHYCWLSTTNQQDSITRRMQRGYEPVRAEDVPGSRDLQHYSTNTGQYAGCVQVNEMVLFRVPRRIWEMQMEEYHQRRPAEFEEAIRSKDQAMAAQVQAKGAKVIQERDVLLGQEDEDVGFRQEYDQPLLSKRPGSRWS